MPFVTSPEPPKSTQPFESRCPVVLLIEDEETILRMTETILRNNGYRVLPSQTADEAATLWDEHRDEIQVVIADLNLRGANGAVLARNMQADRPDLPVIIASGGECTRRLSAEFDRSTIRWLQKPYSIADLREALKLAIK